MSDRVTEIIASYPGTERADKVCAAVRGLAEQTTYARIILCELAWEIRERAYWTVVRRADGSAYADYYDLMRDVLGRDLKKSALDNLSQLGHALIDWPPTSREWARQQLVALGWSRARHFVTPLKQQRGDCRALILTAAHVKDLPTWRQATRYIARTFGTQRQGGKHTVAACPTCGRVLRNRRLRIQRPAGEVAERLLKEVTA
jgi:hypothetical protein